MQFRKKVRTNAHPKNGWRWYLAAFLLSAGTAALFILPFWAKQGVFYIGSDFVHQEVPFWGAANAAIKRGNIFWDDTLDLGTQFIGGYSFYGLGSPFFWLSLLVPSRLIPAAMPLLLILKLGTAGLSAFAWLRSQTKTPQWALLCSILYAFCGFQISSMNFNHFADSVALFPFLLLALDGAVLKKQRLAFPLMVAACALANWYCFVGNAVFLALYFAAACWCGRYPALTIQRFLRLAAQSILGVGLAAVLLVPSALMMLGNPRTASSFESVWRALVPKPIVLAELLRGMLMPPECGFSRAFFMEGLFNGGELYLPMFGLVLAAAFVLHRRKSFEARLLLLCAVCMVVPILNSAFVAFNAEYYTRWFYMVSLILCLATAKTLEDTSIPIKKGYRFYGGLWAAFGLVFVAFTYYYKVTFVYNLAAAVVYVGISVLGFCITLLVRKIQRWRHGYPALLAGVVAFSAVCGGYNIYRMQKAWANAAAPKALYTTGETLHLPAQGQYHRLDADGYYFYNIGVAAGVPAMDSFSSTVQASVFDFYDLMGEPRSVISNLPDEQYGYRAFLSVKYWARYGAETGAAAAHGWQSYAVQGNYHIYQNQWYIPLGYCFDACITEENFQAIPQEQRHLALVQALVLSEETAQRYADILPQAASVQATQQAFEQAVQQRAATAAHTSTKTNTGYTLQISMQQQNLVFLSIPWDAGWSATANGQPVPIEKAAAGLMAVPCPSGEVTLQLTYQPPGLAAGVALTLLSAAGLLVWCRWQKKGSKQPI